MDNQKSNTCSNSLSSLLSGSLTSGARVQYVQSRPYGYAPIIATGTITDIQPTKRGPVQIRVKPDAAHLLTKWRDPDDIISYIWKTAETAAA